MMMKQNNTLCTFGFLAFWILLTSTTHAFSILPTTTIATTAVLRTPLSAPSSSSLALFALPKQNPGESDMDYIKRLTNHSKNIATTATAAASSSSSSLDDDNNNNDNENIKPKGKYQRIEEWDAERKAKGEMSWEERVQYEGQRYGNQVRQNDILQRNLHTF